MYDKDNIFAKIIKKKIPCDLIYEDDSVMFREIKVRDLTTMPRNRISLTVIICRQNNLRSFSVILNRFTYLGFTFRYLITWCKISVHINRHTFRIKVPNMSVRCNTYRAIFEETLYLLSFRRTLYNQYLPHLYDKEIH